MTYDSFTDLIAEAVNPQRLSADGQALSLMTKLLIDIHQLSQRCLYQLEVVYNEAEKVGLKRENFIGSILPDDAWRSFHARFLDSRYDSFVKAVTAWSKSLPDIPTRVLALSEEKPLPVIASEYLGEPEDTDLSEICAIDPFTLCVLLSTISDSKVPERSAGESLSESLLLAMNSFSRYALSHNALEFSLTPLLKPPSFNPLIESAKEYKSRCDQIIDQHIKDTLEIYDRFGSVAYKKRREEEKHIRVLAYRLLYPERAWDWIASQPEIKLSNPAALEGAQDVAKRIGFKLPKSRR